MKNKKINIIRLLFSVVLLLTFVSSILAYNPAIDTFNDWTISELIAVDSTETDTFNLPFPFDDKSYQTFGGGRSPLFFKDPSGVKKGFRYDPETGEYLYEQKFGERNYRNPDYMTLDEYLDYDMKESNRDFWKQKSDAQTLNESQGFAPSIPIKGELFDRIFGGNSIDIRPQGSAELSFGLNVSRRDNPILPERQRRTTTFDFNQKIQLNVIGNIGENMKLNFNYNTEATFDFENEMKLKYEGDEDAIIQKIEAGNVSFPLQSSLITGSQTLFGVKTDLKFGRLTVSSIFSQEKGEKKEINVSGGAQVQEFEKSAAEYEDNKHYFLSHMFRELYESSLANLPRITSRINVTAVEVYITNTQASFNNTRNILAFTDLGTDRRISSPALVQRTGPGVADNASNNLYPNLTGGYGSANAIRQFLNSDEILQNQNLESGVDYERLENAVKLSPNEYTLNPQLGYISLNRTLGPQDVLAVSYRYTFNGQPYQVGDLSTDGIDGQEALFLQLLKGTIINPDLPNWDLMMKNVYSLDAFNIGPNNFELNIWYLNPESGVEIPYFPQGTEKPVPLITTLGLDRISVVNDPSPDGLFDFISGTTIYPQNGRIIFPVLEPFGDYIRKQIPDGALAEKYAFDSLYSTTKILAQQDVDHNRYTFKGKYESSSGSEISLNAFNIPQGSVVVTAGGVTLTENVDYTVDYNLGRVRILNEGILASGQPIKVSLGSNSLFSIQTKTLIGSRFDYRISEDINVGATVMNLTERPLTRKINIGDEPISNTVVGVDGTYTDEAPFLTKMADLLPFYATKEKSTITVTGEAAKLFPGNSKAITKDGVAYIDDFEGSQTVLDIRTANNWKLASVPQGQPELFPEGGLNNTREHGYNRALLSWYTIDPLFFRNDSRTPAHIKNSDEQANNYSREIIETEVFPNKDPEPGLINNLPTLDLAFYPKERGPYNYETKGSNTSAGLNTDGSLADPRSRWGGIMREITSSDFEASNVEFIQFWIMDPFNEQDGNPNHSGGDLYFNLGSVSEDVLKDARKSFENGFPADGGDQNTATTQWGRVPTIQSVINAFDNTLSARPNQDIGLDGFADAGERSYFSSYIDTLRNILNPAVVPSFENDPSNDNFHYYRGSDYDNQGLSILQRYKRFNGHQGNSPSAEQSPESYPTAATTLPDVEDVNRNFNLDRTESYYQYRIKLTPNLLQPNNVGNGFITDVVRAVENVNGKTKEVNWYQFKVPIRKPEKVIGSIRDFKSIRFMRMFLKGFDEEVVIRFARLGLVRGEWREFFSDDLPPGDTHGNEPGAVTFNISAVNVEENSNRVPINYTIPPDINREIDFGTTNLRQLNEQSLVLDVCDLPDGYSKHAFRYLDLDIRQYEKIKMYAHAEAGSQDQLLNHGDVSIIMRLGTDFENNYYEYEVPLQVTLAGQNVPEQVWPDANRIELDLDKLVNAKQLRNRQLVTTGSGVSTVSDFEIQDGGNIIRIKGNPNLAEVQVVMLGVKNPRSTVGNQQDDGLEKCAEVWVNELRLSGFNNHGGWAAQARLSAQIADLATVNLSGSMSTPGWGSLEQKLNERQRETRKQYDFSTSTDLGKFLPEGTNIAVPMFYSISEGIIRPEYSPLDPDVKLKDMYASNEFTQSYKDSIRKITDDYTRRRSINFSNVRKNPGPNKKKKNFYDIENFSVSYAYTNTVKRDITTKTDNQKDYKGSLNYSFSAKAKNIEPFKKSKFLKKKKGLRFIKDLNFNPVPSQFSIQNQFNRTYHARQARNISNTGFNFESPAFYQKTFNWARNYNLRYNPTKSITFNFTASNRALISEPEGRVDKRERESYEKFKREVWSSIQGYGDNTNYNHNFDLNYKIPFNKFPGLDFINGSARYSGTFAWDIIGNPGKGADTLGSTIQNSNTKTLQSTLNMETFYNKFEYIRQLKNPNIKEDIELKENKKKKKQLAKIEKKEAKEKEKLELNPADSVATASLKKLEEERKKINEREEDTLKLKKNFFKDYLFDNTLHTIMSLKTVSVNYNESNGTILPNYGMKTNMLGMESGWTAPGFGFVSGQQLDNDEYLQKAFNEGWLVDGIFVSGDFSRTYSKQLNLRATLRPIDGLNIQLTATKTTSESFNQFFFFDDTLATPTYNFDAPPIISGSYTTSFLSFKTAFEKDDKLYNNAVFDDLRANRIKFSERLADLNPNSLGRDTAGYRDGYGASSQEVMLYSFISAYSGESTGGINIKDFTKILPMPNWNIRYDGLSRIPFFKKYFKSININHRYRSTFSIGSYTRNPLYDEENNAPISRDINNNFIADRQYSNATIMEQFSPLLGLSMTWNNSLITNIEFKQDRNASMSFTNNQVTEIKGKEYVIGLGYKISNLKLPFKVGGLERSSDLDVRVDVTMRDNQTIIRRIVENRNELTAGQRIFSIKFIADYKMSRQLNLSVFYDRVANTPYISSSFPTANTNAGIRLRFTLSQ